MISIGQHVRWTKRTATLEGFVRNLGGVQAYIQGVPMDYPVTQAYVEITSVNGEPSKAGLKEWVKIGDLEVIPAPAQG